MSRNSLFPQYDPKSASNALRSMLEQIYTWRNELFAQAKEPDLASIPDEYRDDMHVGMMHSSTYADVACSNAAVGGLAPLFEGVFQHEFDSLRVAFAGRQPPNDHHRWKLEREVSWTPRVVSEKGTRADLPDIVRGTKQLIDALAIGERFPNDIHDTINALFSFRNRALHNGYEWPIEVRNSFNQLVQGRGWGHWFAWGRTGDQLWMVSATDAFVRKCLDTLGQVIEAFERIRSNWGGYSHFEF